MSNGRKNAAEKTFQENFVQELCKYGWNAPEELNGNTHKVTVQDLISNWRQILNRMNIDKLEGVELTDNEFAQVLARVNQISNSYEAAKLLAAENGKGKIDGIWRDSNPNVTQKQITLTIFCKAEIIGGNTSYQIAREVQTEKGNRFDLVLLICGLPLINIELKRTDKTIDEAFCQFHRYYKDGEYINNFMAFSQMMVITSEIDTEYFATPKTANDFNRAFSFHWSDKKNKPITEWRRIVSDFLKIPMAHQMVGDYLVINEAENEEDRKHLLMRPYQVYALQAIELASKGRDELSNGFAHGGYIWHTTGSGKTITSFKTALFLSTRAGFDKIIFLVDRRELDANTSQHFKEYAIYESVDVDETKYTYQLKQKLKSPKNGIVVTTIFKLHSLVKEFKENQDYSLSEKNFVFIIDEAHRSTMKRMMKDIRDYFNKKALFYGFTGTPLFDENKAQGMVNEKSEVINTTEKLFGPCLHDYTIDTAIRDKNVLGFHVDYINTGEFKSYDDLKDKLIESIKNKHPERSNRNIEREVSSYSNLEVEKKSIDYDLLKYQDETHIPRVVEDILKNWDSQSDNRFFNSILTTGKIARAIKYFQEFKEQQKNAENPINIAVTFSFGNENDDENIAKNYAEEIFRSYEKFTGQKFITGDAKHGEDAYFQDLISRTKRGGSGRNPKNIDLVIVADQMLTGYDSKLLNTLYVDRSLELQNLIQAYSRTNRILGPTKEFGTIINYQYPAITENSVNRALELYGSGGESSRVIVDTYDVAVQNLIDLIINMKQTLPEPTHWKYLEEDESAKQLFIKAYKKAAGQMNTVMQYYEYEWDDNRFGIDEHTWLKYKGAYKNLMDEFIDPTPIPVIHLEGKTRIVGTGIINATYILKLIGDKISTDSGTETIDGESLRLILEKIQELSDMGEAGKADLLHAFLDDLKDGKLKGKLTIEEAFEQWKNKRIESDIKTFATEWGIDFDLLKTSFYAFKRSPQDGIPRLQEISASVNIEIATRKSPNKLMHNIELAKVLPKWLKETNKKYV